MDDLKININMFFKYYYILIIIIIFLKVEDFEFGVYGLCWILSLKLKIQG